MISVTGYYTTRFGELWEQSLFDLIHEALHGVLENEKLNIDHINAIFFGNMLGGVLENNLHAGAKIAEIMGTNVPIYRVEAACASGGMAFNMAHTYLSAYSNKTVVVLGAEKMTDYQPELVVSALSAAASGEEQEVGLTFPGLYALLARTYLDTYGYSEKDLAYVSVKNHYHGTLNNNAQFKRNLSISDVMNSPYVAHPLKVLDSSPISDGASAVILTNDSKIIRKASHSVSILATEVAMDTISLSKRKRLDELAATKNAAQKAFKKAKIKPKDISIAEVHDCFSIAELLAMEDIGFWKKGTAGKKIKEMKTMYGNGNNLIVNSSGGLKAAGHPVGATGVKQIGEVFLQLTHQAKKRQIKNGMYGLAHNVGGAGGTAVVTILGN